jgi:uncharacterized membrane protein
MNWAGTAILSAATSAAVNIFDSHLITKRLPGMRSFIFMVGIFHMIPSLVVMGLYPLPANVDIDIVLLALLSAVIRSVSILILFYCLTREEVSRVVPVMNTYPIFVAILAVPLLGEHLRSVEWFAVFIVVVGAVTVSFRQSPSGTVVVSRLTALLFVSSLLMAVADLISKYVLGFISFWNVYWLEALLISVLFIVISARSTVFKQLTRIENKLSCLILFIADELFATIGLILATWSRAEGPVSLVSTITSSRPMFVLVYALILSRLLPGFLEWQSGGLMLVFRLAGTAMIVGGLAIIYL